ncbi:MAG: hypothetical protein NT149_02470 [Candidatus Gottesmanbacteria bacterium]|nr:hypothetical protein [Candidatus Gottesmanbacteria bacterium]
MKSTFEKAQKIIEKTNKVIAEKSKTNLALDVEGVCDVLDDGEKLVYLTNEGKTVDSIVIGNVTYTPPVKSESPYLFSDKDTVLKLISAPSDPSDADLYVHLLEYHRRISDLPNELYYDLLVLWDFHTHIIDKLHFSPILYLFAVKERGKSRTGKGCLYVSRRGVFTETVREPDIIRWGNDHKAALGFDVKNFPKKIERANCDDLILARYERGSSSSRTLWPERGPFRDTKSFKLFGPTIVMTNRPVDDIIESRAISIDMKPSARVFNDPVLPEDALDLKAKLTGFRFRHKDTKLKKIDKPLPGRLGDIMSPLHQIVHTFFPEKTDTFNSLLTLISQKKQDEATDSFEAQVVEAVIASEPQVSDGFLAVEIVTNAFNEGKNDPRFVVRKDIIGRILKGLGFTSKRSTGGKSVIYYDPELIKSIATQYGLASTYNSGSLGSLPSSELANDEAKLKEPTVSEQDKFLDEMETEEL